MVLVAAFLPGRIRVTVIDVKAFPFTPTTFPQFLILQELAAVVGGDALEFLPESRRISLDLIYGFADGLSFPIRQFAYDFLVTQPLRQGQQNAFSSLAADYQVHFPVSKLSALVYILRPSLDAGQFLVCHPSLRSLCFGALFPFLPKVLVA